MSARSGGGPAFAKAFIAGLLFTVYAGAGIAADRESVAVEEVGPIVSGQWLLPGHDPWPGEVFELALRWRLFWPRFNFLEGDVQWSSDDLVAGPWSRAVTVPPADGSDVGFVSATVQAMALAPGSLTLSPARQSFSLYPTTTGIAGRPRLAHSELAESASGQLHIAELPPAPQHFSGAVGSFELTSVLNASEAAVGDAVAWTVTLRGMGNWPMRPALPARRLPPSFAVLEPPVLQQLPGASPFEGGLQETLLLAPTAEGIQELPAVQVVVFDPRVGDYLTLTAPALTLRATPGIWSPGEAEPEALAPRWAPIAGAGSVQIPLADDLWIILMLLPIAGVLTYWLALSLLFAWKSDPWREPRRSHRQLQRLIPLISESTDATQLYANLRVWQRLTARRFSISSAAPTPADLVGNGEWATLWRDVDTVLYSGATALPAGWIERAGVLLADTPAPPGFRPGRALDARHLLARPRGAVALLCLAALMTPMLLPAQVAPTDIPGDDWVASYNRALELMEKQRVNEAAAFAAAAWLRSPADSRAHALWLHSAREAGFATGNSLRPVNPLLANLLGVSPAAWRWTAVAAIGIVTLAAGFALARRFGRRAPPVHLYIGMSVFGVCALLISVGLLRQYGLAASPDSVMLLGEATARRLPIEQPDDDQAPVLPAGTVARVDKSLLGWRRLCLETGESVWVQRSELLWLWRDNPYSYPNYLEARAI